MKLYLLYFVNISLVAVVSFGQNWNNWRGPNFNGSSDTTESLPEKFDNITNVKWKYNLPGPSGGTPIINEQFVFISSIASTGLINLKDCLWSMLNPNHD